MKDFIETFREFMLELIGTLAPIFVCTLFVVGMSFVLALILG